VTNQVSHACSTTGKITVNIVKAIKSRRMRWVGNVARMGEMLDAIEIFIGEPDR
jgi:hypothetical protein